MQPNKPVVLVVDDDPVNLDILVQTLEQDYFLIIAKNGKRALDLAFSHHPDLILLDILMPEMDGFEVCQRLKADKETEGIPVIFLSVMESPGQKHRGFEVGGVDYVTKPFSPSELVARVDALYRRVALQAMREENNFHEEIRSGEFVLNLRKRTLTKKGSPVDLTQVEFQIMEYFLSNPGMVLERNKILTRIWGEDYYGEEKIVDVNIRRLRMKIEDEPSRPRHVVTVWGIGYKWEA